MQKTPYLVLDKEPGQTNQRNPQSRRQLLRRMTREHVLLGGAAWVASGQGARRTWPEASKAGSTQSGEPNVGPGRGHRPLPPQSPVRAKVNVCLVYCTINDSKTDSKKLT